MSKSRYFVLGKGCSSFYDPSTQLKVVGKGSTEYKGKISKRIEIALKHRHIEEVENAVTEEEVAKAAADAEEPTPLEDMTKKELINHYKDNFEVSKDDLAAFSKMNKEEMLEFLAEDE